MDFNNNHTLLVYGTFDYPCKETNLEVFVPHTECFGQLFTHFPKPLLSRGSLSFSDDTKESLFCVTKKKQRGVEERVLARE